jgi:hypothetical protein
MQNAMGEQLSRAQTELIECYETLVKVLEEDGDELAPFEKRNAVKAASVLWQIVNGLDLDPGHPYHVGA